MATPVQPNYVNPETQGHSVLAVSVVFGGITLLAVIARFWARAVILRQVGWDDYVVVVALALAIAYTAVTNVAIYSYGLDRHAWDVLPANHVHLLYYLWWMFHTFTLATAAVKVSLLLFYRRVLARSSGRLFHWLNNFLLYFVIAYAIGVTLGMIFYCRPVRSFWMRLVPDWAATNEFHCPENPIMLPIGAVFGAATDLAVVLLPLLFLRNLKISRGQMWGLRTLFGLGFLICAASAVRSYYIFVLYGQKDYSWNGYAAGMWGAIEAYISIACASAPALKPFFSTYVSGPLSNVFSRYGRTEEYGTGGSARRRYGFPSIKKRRGRDDSGESTIDKDVEMRAGLSDTRKSEGWDERNASSQTELRAPDRVLKSVTYGVEYEQRQAQSRS